MSRRIIASCGLALLAAVAIAGCGGGSNAGTTSTDATAVIPATTLTTIGAVPETPTTLAPAPLEPIVVPTLPAVIPGYTEIDPATGLHMTGTPTVVDFAVYRLKVSGLVANELSLSYDDLRRLPKLTASPNLVCVGFFTDTATWSGASLETVLQMAGIQDDAERIALKAADGYSISLTLEEALRPENFLAYELEGQPIPVLHGFPIRAVIPGENGNYWVKWLTEIEVA